MVLLCYPADSLIKDSCDNFKAQMKKCGHEVLSKDDLTAEEASVFLKGVDESIPVFISSHGNSFGKKHYLNSSKGNIPIKTLGKMDEWKLPRGVSTRDSGEEPEGNVFATLPILKALGKRPKVLSTCFSGRACQEAHLENIVASCSFDEVSIHRGIPEKYSQEPVLYWIGELYCNDKLFASVDGKFGKKDGELSREEIAGFLATKMGGKTTIAHLFTPQPLNLDPVQDAATIDYSMVPDKGTKMSAVSDESERKEQAEAAAARNSTEKKNIKTRVYSDRQQMFALTLDDGSSLTLPGFYMSPESAEKAAKQLIPLLTAQKLISKAPEKIKVKSLGKVFSVVEEDLTQPCHSDMSGDQTPLIQGTIRSKKH